MAGTYTLELELLATYVGAMPVLQIYEDGALFNGYSISSSGTSLSLTINYGGALPSSLQFRFLNDGAEGGRTIEIQSVKINERYVNRNNYLSTNSLTSGGNSDVDVVSGDFLFDSSDPNLATFTAGATKTYTVAADSYHGRLETVDQIFTMLAGRDVAYLGSGDDTVSGGDDNDILRGGLGNDLLFGDSGNDRIYGEEGDDKLYGGDGDDHVYGGDGNDEIYGGLGNDALNGNDGNDIILGGDGGDRINGGVGDDFLYGDAGDDVLVGAAGADTLDGGLGNDLLFGGAGNDILNGGDGLDMMYGGTGDDIISGDAGDDTLYGDQGNDILRGSDGADFLEGGAGDDTLYGDADNDILKGGAGADTIYGGDGNDILHGNSLTGQQIKAILDANINVVYNAQTNSFYEFVNNDISWAAASSDATSTSLNGIAGHLANVTSLFENDFLSLLAGGNNAWLGAHDVDQRDVIVWQNGIEAGANFWNGDDTGGSVSSFYQNWRTGEPDSDDRNYIRMRNNGQWDDRRASDNEDYIIEWDAGLMNDDNAIDTLSGGNGDDMIYGYGGNDVLDGGSGQDLIFGGTGNDIISGGDDNDALFGNDGNDIISGDNGNDHIDGGAGDDLIYASAGLNVFIGGADTDTFSIIGSTISALAFDIDLGTGLDTYGNTYATIENVIGGTNDDTITGDGIANNISGEAGNDILEGGAGNDVIYGSNSVTSAINQISIILAANAGVTYNESTGNFYQHITTNADWGTANTNANATTLNGVNGHLAVISSQEENDHIFSIGGGQRIWIGGSDAASEGTWRWVAGPENNTQFWAGDETGAPVGGYYSNWVAGDPSNGSAVWDYVEFRADGTWWANASTASFDYIVEWEGDAVLGTTGTDTLYGGDGSDTLYGTDGVQDIFKFMSGDTGTDTINRFASADTDAIDIGNLLTGYTAGVSDIKDFVQFTNSGANTLIQIDADGTAGGIAFTTIGQINGVNDLDADALFYNGSIIA